MSRTGLSPILDQALTENTRCMARVVDAFPSLPASNDRLALAGGLTNNARALRELAALYFRAATLNDLAAAELLDQEADG
jgi:hypothetical protein